MLPATDIQLSPVLRRTSRILPAVECRNPAKHRWTRPRSRRENAPGANRLHGMRRILRESGDFMDGVPERNPLNFEGSGVPEAHGPAAQFASEPLGAWETPDPPAHENGTLLEQGPVYTPAPFAPTAGAACGGPP